MRLVVAMSAVLLTIAACSDVLAGEGRYFIEFRARQSTYIGHTYISYFRTDAGGRVIEAHDAGLVPEDDVWNGVFAPIRASIGRYKDDIRLPTTAMYRRQLSAEEYARVGRAVRVLRASEKSWHVIFYNCNDFAIQIAEALGLRRPPSLLPPSVWVGMLKLVNAP